MTLLFMVGISSTMGIYTMLPLFLVSEHGMDRSLANELIGLSRVLSIAMALLAGVFNDRLGSKRTLMIVLLLSGTMTILLGMAPGFWTVLLVFLQPLMAVSFFPAAFALLFHCRPARCAQRFRFAGRSGRIYDRRGRHAPFYRLYGGQGQLRRRHRHRGGLILAGALLAALLKPNQEDGG